MDEGVRREAAITGAFLRRVINDTEVRSEMYHRHNAENVYRVIIISRVAMKFVLATLEIGRISLDDLVNSTQALRNVSF